MNRTGAIINGILSYLTCRWVMWQSLHYGDTLEEARHAALRALALYWLSALFLAPRLFRQRNTR